MATLQIRGQWAREKNELNMDNNFWRTKGSSDLRNEGGMLSGPTVPLTVFKLTVEISINSWHVKFTDPGILVYKNVCFGFDVGDGTSVVGRCFVWWWEYRWNEIYEEICFFGKIVHLRLYLVDKTWSTSSKTKHENMTLTSKKSTLVCSRFEQSLSISQFNNIIPNGIEDLVKFTILIEIKCNKTPTNLFFF